MTIRKIIIRAIILLKKGNDIMKQLESHECVVQYEGDELDNFNAQSVKCDILEKEGRIAIQTQEDICVIDAEQLGYNPNGKPIYKSLGRINCPNILNKAIDFIKYGGTASGMTRTLSKSLLEEYKPDKFVNINFE